MRKTISYNWLKKQGACLEGLEQNALQTERGTIETLERLMQKDQFNWAHWLIFQLLNKNQKKHYMLYIAENVIDIFEKEFPNDKRPRKAIELSKEYLKKPSKGKKYAVRDATDAAFCSFVEIEDVAWKGYTELPKKKRDSINATVNAAMFIPHATGYIANYMLYSSTNSFSNYELSSIISDSYTNIKEKILRHGISMLEA